jgi:diaminohydroxyphosphoribosylaminopyrimidine deaminase/5-amino-6-(5-phosphoribosylamino)uracil reductase
VALKDAAARLRDCGVVIERVDLDPEGHVDVTQALRALSARGVTRVFSEGGPRVAARLIELGLADDIVVITAEKPLGRPGLPSLSKEARAALLDDRRFAAVDRVNCGQDVLRLFARIL